MIKIRYLSECESHIPEIARIWVNSIGKKWRPGVSQESIESRLREGLHSDSLPLAYVALDNETPVGICRLLSNDLQSRPKLFPWLGSLCVDENYRKRGIGKLLMQVVQNKAKEMGFRTIYLFTFDEALVQWYESMNWREVEKADFEGTPITIMSLKLTF
ncbi:MAG: hypothetical protein RLZZ59_610 [Pseudomonadota bacterium]|jgi:predicted N-acetyltransferase YhbS